MPVLTGFRVALTTFGSALALGLAPGLAPHLAAQTAAQTANSPAPPPAGQATPTPTPAPAPAPDPATDSQPRVNLMVTVPRGETNKAQAQQCRNDADAGTISGEIVVCAEGGKDANAQTGSRAETQKRYAQETAFKGAPPPPDMFGIPDNGKGIGFGKAPPPPLFIDVGALPTAPAGSDADRIARGLQPTGAEEELSEEQERARREAEGIKTTVPQQSSKKKKG